MDLKGSVGLIVLRLLDVDGGKSGLDPKRKIQFVVGRSQECNHFRGE